MLAADLLDRDDRKEESADNPKDNLHPDQERKPFMYKRRQTREIHDVPPQVFVVLCRPRRCACGGADYCADYCPGGCSILGMSDMS